jgi:hypothetical protein
LCEPNKLNPFTSAFQVLQREDAISRFELRKLFEESGFEVLAISEILLRDPASSDLLMDFEIYKKIERIFEKIHLGVTVLGIGKSTG